MCENYLMTKVKDRIQLLSNFTLKIRHIHTEVKETVAELVKVFSLLAAKERRVQKTQRDVTEKTSKTLTKNAKVKQIKLKLKDAETSTPYWWDINTTEILDDGIPQWPEVVGRHKRVKEQDFGVTSGTEVTKGADVSRRQASKKQITKRKAKTCQKAIRKQRMTFKAKRQPRKPKAGQRSDNHSPQLLPFGFRANRPRLSHLRC